MSSVDRFQREHPVIGLPLAVIYKFFEDQGNYLAAILTYYAFIAIFPLLLLASSILGFLLQGNPELQDAVLNSALRQFPIIGQELGRPEAFTGSTVGIVVGVLAATYGAMGLGQAIQNAMNIAWSVPRNSRPNPFLLRLKSLLLLVASAVAVVAVSTVSVLGSSTEVFGSQIDVFVRLAIYAVSVIAVGLGLTVLFRVAASRRHGFGRSAPGAFVTAILWQSLQWAGTIYAQRVLAETAPVNATFGLVLGLIGIIYLASLMGVIGIEVNVVLARRLWPRALLTPFTDAVDLTDADRRAYAAYAQMQRHKGFETVTIRFDGRDGEAHEFVPDPASPKDQVQTGVTPTVPTYPQRKHRARSKAHQLEPLPASPVETKPAPVTAGEPEPAPEPVDPQRESRTRT